MRHTWIGGRHASGRGARVRLAEHAREQSMARIVMPVGEDYEDSEFQVPYDRLRKPADLDAFVNALLERL